MKITLRKQVKEALGYIRDSRNYIYFIFLLFIVSAIFGFVFSAKLGFLNRTLAQLANQARGLDTKTLILFILQNNVQASLVSLVLGFAFGIFPLFTAFANGTILGYVLFLVWRNSGFLEFWRILPHGIFELPAIFIALGLGVRLGFSVFEGKKQIWKNFYNSVNVFLFVILPLLIVAAVIEGLLIVLIK